MQESYSKAREEQELQVTLSKRKQMKKIKRLQKKTIKHITKQKQMQNKL